MEEVTSCEQRVSKGKKHESLIVLIFETRCSQLVTVTPTIYNSNRNTSSERITLAPSASPV